jgi:hypothetical protein
VLAAKIAMLRESPPAGITTFFNFFHKSAFPLDGIYNKNAGIYTLGPISHQLRAKNSK